MTLWKKIQNDIRISCIAYVPIRYEQFNQALILVHPLHIHAKFYWFYQFGIYLGYTKKPH